MYDTLHLWLPSEVIGQSNYMETLPPILGDFTTHDPTDRPPYITGNKLGMALCISSNGISLKGSICKSYLNDNFKTLTRQDTQRAIERLSDTLNMPVKDAKVTRIDFAENMIVDQPPKNYYIYLGNCQRYQRFVQPKSIYYQNSTRTKLFYNKIAEAKSKDETIPPIWAGSNVLRYELRYVRNLPKQFNVAQVKVQDLYNEQFYAGMIDRWIAEYQNINKLNEINFNTKTMKQPKDFWEQLLLQKVHEVGQPNLLALVDELKAKNVFKQKEYYSRVRKEIKKKCRANSIEQTNDLIKELDTKILQVKEQYR